MTASHADWRRRASRVVLAGTAALFLTAAELPAQQESGTAPLQLLPLAPSDGTGSQVQPLALQPAASQDGDQPAAVEQPVQRQGIEVNSLNSYSPDAIGLLTADQGGLGESLWQATSYDTALRWLPRLPDRITSPALRRLALLLLTSSAPPPGNMEVASLNSAVGSPNENQSRLLALRVDRLMAMGEVERVAQLLAAVPGSAMTDDLQRIRTEVALIAERHQEACQDIRQGIALNPSGSFWAKGMIFCQIMDGQLDQAQLGLDLLREQDGEESALFATIATHLAGSDALDLPAGAIEPIDFAVLRALNYPLPEDLSDRIGPELLAAVATAPNAGISQRIWAGEEALQRGLIDGATLAGIYDAFEFSLGQLDSAMSEAPNLPGTEARALLYQAFGRQKLPAARGEVMRRYLDLAASSGRYEMAVQVLLPALAAMEVRSDMAWFAETAAKAFFVLGHYEQAGAWLRVLQRGAATKPELKADLLQLWPFVRISGAGGWAGQPTIVDWSAADAGEATPTESGEADNVAAAPGDTWPAALLLANFQPLGIEDPLTWEQLAAASGGASLGTDQAELVMALRGASSRERLGESLLYSLVLLGRDQDGSKPEILHLQSVLAGLAQAGLWQEARALAAESLIEYGY